MRHDWREAGIIHHIYTDGLEKDLDIFEAFEIQFYIELHLLGASMEFLQRVSNYIHQCAADICVENIKNADFKPATIENIVQYVEEGKPIFLVIDHGGIMRIVEDEMFFMVFMKRGYWFDHNAHIVVSANKILKEIGYSAKRMRKGYIRNALQRALERLFLGRKTEIVYLDPSITQVHALLKQPNKEVHVYTNDVGKITAVHEIRSILKKPKSE